MKYICALWLLFVASFAFAQDVDLGIELAVRPSPILSMGQIGLLDVTVTNYGATEKIGSISIDGVFPRVNFLAMVPGQCTPVVYSPPPPGTPYFGLYRTPVLLVGNSVTCTFPFQLDGFLPQSTIIGMKVTPYPTLPADGNQSNNTASIDVKFIGIEPVPATKTLFIFLLIGLIIMLAGMHVGSRKV